MSVALRRAKMGLRVMSQVVVVLLIRHCVELFQWRIVHMQLHVSQCLLQSLFARVQMVTVVQSVSWTSMSASVVPAIMVASVYTRAQNVLPRITLALLWALVWNVVARVCLFRLWVRIRVGVSVAGWGSVALSM